MDSLEEPLVQLLLRSPLEDLELPPLPPRPPVALGSISTRSVEGGRRALGSLDRGPCEESGVNGGCVLPLQLFEEEILTDIHERGKGTTTVNEAAERSKLLSEATLRTSM